MGSAMSSVYARVFGKMEERILMLGLDAAGKTTILYKLKLGEVMTTIPTIGFNVETVSYSSNARLVSFTTWDVGGRDKIRALWRHYYQQGNALIFVVDSNDRDRSEQAADEIVKVLSEDECKDWPLLVFANKQDLPNAMPVAELADKLNLHALRDRDWFIQASCAMNGEGLYDGLDWLCGALHRKGQPGHRVDSRRSQSAQQQAFTDQSGKRTDPTESDVDTDVPESTATEATEQEM